MKPTNGEGHSGARSTGTQVGTLTQATLRIIWQEHRISRAEIARRAGLSRSTVTEIVDELLTTGLVSEVGVGPSRGGRPPIVLEFNYQAGCILGVDMGATHVAVALTDLRGEVLGWQHRFHSVRTDPVGTRALIAELCTKCLDSEPGSRKRLLGVGVAVPCPVDPKHPDHFSTLVLPDWRGRGELKSLATRFRVPLFVDNDANLGALAERWWGAGRGVDDFAYVKVATGVGSGHFLQGDVYRGATGVAGEIGHLAIDPNGRPCVCGLRGCLATLVGAPALVERAAELRARFPNSILSQTSPTIETIEDAALLGDPLAMQIVTEAAGHLGIAIAGLLNLMNPRLVIVGGGIARLGDRLLEPLREVIRSRTLVSSLAVAEVRTSELGPRSIAVGAATYVLVAALDDMRLFPCAREHSRSA
ncbi:MAG: ROK family transcriptional regulator [Candidatus Eisenbacteria bacterium]|uniref:ROK family transcriptional regulator n=1 Tax=Eiseniibacteriota bacterium TaxID=2212470 RepID=A0A849SBQ8_UNCEI|nr:ROK family transcriptional regulator [Candidatus Eisenbacteria bacterium]